MWHIYTERRHVLLRASVPEFFSCAVSDRDRLRGREGRRRRGGGFVIKHQFTGHNSYVWRWWRGSGWNRINAPQGGAEILLHGRSWQITSAVCSLLTNNTKEEVHVWCNSFLQDFKHTNLHIYLPLLKDRSQTVDPGLLFDLVVWERVWECVESPVCGNTGADTETSVQVSGWLVVGALSDRYQSGRGTWAPAEGIRHAVKQSKSCLCVKCLCLPFESYPV